MNRIQSIGVAIFLVSLGLLAIQFIPEFISDFIYNSEISLLIRLGVTGLLGGIVIILLSLIKERLNEVKK